MKIMKIMTSTCNKSQTVKQKQCNSAKDDDNDDDLMIVIS